MGHIVDRTVRSTTFVVGVQLTSEYVVSTNAWMLSYDGVAMEEDSPALRSG
jgi:hypothetical protein